MDKQEIEKALNWFKPEIKSQESGYAFAIANGQDTNKHFEDWLDYMRIAVECMEQQLTGGWIPVSERLPEIPTEKLNEGFTRRQVLVFTNTEPRKRIAWFDIENNKFHDDYSMFGTVTEVTQWQYLPDDPKEDKDAERN